MNNVKMNIWGRVFELDIVFDALRDGTILDNQKKTLELFFKTNSSKIVNDNLEINSITEIKGENVIETPIDKTKSLIEDYCLENANEDIDIPITNIFKYVIPKYLYISRTKDETRRISLMCNFKFDMEHGLAIIFKNEEFEKIGEQGLVL